MTPATHYLLMTGRQAKANLEGWVPLAQDIRTAADLTSLRRELWPHVAAQLEAEAAPFNFTPWGAKGKRPTAAAVKAWEHQFLARHGH